MLLYRGTFINAVRPGEDGAIAVGSFIQGYTADEPTDARNAFIRYMFCHISSARAMHNRISRFLFSFTPPRPLFISGLRRPLRKN